MSERVVKRYIYSSPNQEAVLTAFDEEGWPRRIHDPLRPVAGKDSKRRLRDTIGTLNVKQENCLIRFRAAGTGEHVIWEPVQKYSRRHVGADLFGKRGGGGVQSHGQPRGTLDGHQHDVHQPGPYGQ